MNYFRTTILLATMTAIFMAIGFMLGGEGGMIIAFLFALMTNLFAYWNADKIVLRMYKAEPVGPENQLYGIVTDLAQRAQIPMPKVYIIHNDQPNAFATGRNPEHAAVAATTGMMRVLSREEITAVMAHELAHVKNRDTLTMTITATIAGAIGMLANYAMFFGSGNNRNNPLGVVGMILIMILAPIAAMLVQMAISRTREYEADRIGSEICGQPLWLASALEKIHNASQRFVNPVAENNPATAHMFIMNPLHARSIDNLFSTHPNTANRIAQLQKLAGQMRTGGKLAPTNTIQYDRPTGTKGPWG